MTKKPTAELIAELRESAQFRRELASPENEECMGLTELARKYDSYADRLAELTARNDKLEMALELWQQMWPGMRDCIVNEGGWHMKDAHKDNMDAAYKYGEKALQSNQKEPN